MNDDEIYEYLGQTFEWNADKARKNFMRHRVMFTEAATVFFDRSVAYYKDLDHSEDEQRIGVRMFGSSVRGLRLRGKGASMKANWEDDYEMPEEYDLSKLKRVPNPFAQRFEDLNLVPLEEDVKAVFPDSDAVNAALRTLIKAASAAVPADMKKAS